MTIEEILSLSLEERIDLIDKAKKAYYETADPIMSDEDYDELEESVLVETSDIVSVGVNSRHNKAEHTNPMLSLGKYKIDKDETNTLEILEELLEKYNEFDLTLSFKYDGLAMNVEFEDGKLKQIVTRGNRLKGVNRTAKLRHIIDGNEDWEQFFEYHQKGEVRCECVMSQSVFDEHYADSGKKHPRNMAAGLVADENLETGRGHLRLVVLEGIAGDGHIMDVSILPDYKVCAEDISDIESLVDAFNFLKDKRSSLGVPTDGLVLAQQIVNQKFEHNGSYPNHAVAIKFTPPKFETIITNIEWKLQKTGRYVPKVHFEPFIVDGRSISKASGHGLHWLVSRDLTIGSKICVELSGDIIPYISTI